MQKIVNELISSSIREVDIYRWRDATWLIFTDETRWVVELTDEGTLWYNYKFFKDVFKYVSITVGTEMDGHIIQWANDFFYKDCAHRSAAYPRDKDRTKTSNVIENGIKEINDSSSIHRKMRAENLVPRIIKNIKPNRVIIKGEKMDRFYYSTECAGNNTEIFRIVEEGVKKVKPNIEYSQQSGVFHPDCVANHVKIEKVIEEGVKEVKPNVVFHGIDKSSMSFVPCNGNTTDINIIVKSGIKNIYPDQISGDQGYNWSNEFEADKVIEYGVKL